MSHHSNNHQRRRYQTSSSLVPANAAQQCFDPYRQHATSNRFHSQSSMGEMHPMMPFNSFEDPLGPSLFGSAANLMPQSFFDMSRTTQRQQQLADVDFGGRMMLQHQRSMDSLMGGMMPFMGGGFHGTSPGGCYSSQVMMMSSTTGPDGRQHVEKYAKSSAGNAQHKIRETKEAYSNSTSGVDKIAWERQLDTKARRVVKERNRTGEVVSNDEIAGMSRDDECERFNSDWTRVADDHLDVRANLHPAMLRGAMSQQIGGGQQQQQQQMQQMQLEDITDITDEVQQNSRRAQRGPRSRYA